MIEKSTTIPQGAKVSSLYIAISTCLDCTINVHLKVIYIPPLLVYQVNDLIIPTVDTVRQKFFLNTYVPHNKPLLFVGPTGTGKSAITNNYLVQLPKDKYVHTDTLLTDWLVV